MNLRTLARRSLRHYFCSHLGVLAGVTLAAAVLIGALAVGDSVKGSLLDRALLRLGNANFALSTQDRFFERSLGANFWSTYPEGFALLGSKETPGWSKGTNRLWMWGGIQLRATVAKQDSSARANQVQFFAFGENFFDNLPDDLPRQPADGAWVNAALAQQLGLVPGDTIIIRVPKPSALSHDAILSPKDDASLAFRFPVTAIMPRGFGELDLAANQRPAINVFVPRALVETKLDLKDRANLMLVPGQGWHPREIFGFDSPGWTPLITWAMDKPKIVQDAAWFLRGIFASGPRPAEDTALLDSFNRSLAGAWSVGDAELSIRARELRSIGSEQIPPFAELTTRRIFLEPAVVRAALAKPEGATNSPASAFALPTSDLPATPLLTYLVNGLAHGDKLAPYSMVTAAGAPYTPADLKDDEIVVNQWLADDLGVKPGDAVALTYYRVDAGTQLQEHTNTFRVHSIVPLAGLHADRTLMPEFPGLSKAESTHDWDAGFDLVHTIRDQDEAYWKQHRGTPKAFITLAAGQKLWANRFGELTAIRWFVEGPPSPRPSPPERGGNAVSPSGSDSPTSAPGASVSANEPAQTAAPAPPATSPATPASPSPGGEGQGEGARPSIVSVTELRDALTARIRANLNPADVGLVWRPVREEALRAAESGTGKDFGGLMIGFSFFLITSALLLTAMLFRFSLERRTTEVGILLALGWPPARVRGLLFREGLGLATLGSVLGAVLGIYYAKGVLWGLTTIWRDAIAGAGLSFHLTPVTLLTGIVLSIAVAAGTLFLALRQQVNRPARELLNEGANEDALNFTTDRSRQPKLVALIASVLALGMVAAAWATRETKPEMFFGAGATLLIAGLLWVRVWIRRLGQRQSRLGTAAFSLPLEQAHYSPSLGGEGRGEGGPYRDVKSLGGIENHTRPHPNPLPKERGTTPSAAGSLLPPGSRSLGQFALRSLARRPSRSLGTIALLASAAFLIVAIAAMKLDANRNSDRRESGTGGFALWGESSLPVIQDLNTAKGQEFYGLNPGDLKGVSFVPLRVRDGDDASCLNLNGAQRPRLLGVKPEQLAGRGAFTFTKVLKELAVTNGWMALHSQFPIPNSQAREIPAIGDAASIQWALKSSVGGTLDFTDERGQPFKVRIVGAVANSILQGNLLIAEADFVRLFPSESGYRGFLVDAPPEAVAPVSATLSRALQDVGLELTPTTRRLAQFNAVQNTYLNTFQMLGGLGLLLGSVGLGVVVLRNVQERRGELGLMLALGFEASALRRLVLTEHVALLLLGLGVGLVAALVAVLPSLGAPGSDFPWRSLSVTLGLVLANGLIWTVWATSRSLRGRLVDSLREL